MMKEIWKDIKGHEGLYQISNNIKYQEISACCRKIIKTAGGYKWKYC